MKLSKEVEKLEKELINLTLENKRLLKVYNKIIDFTPKDYQSWGGVEEFSELEKPYKANIKKLSYKKSSSSIMKFDLKFIKGEKGEDLILIGDKTGLGIYGEDFQLFLDLEVNKKVSKFIAKKILKIKKIEDLIELGFEIFES